jgi:small-conductance mechanosensitive channel
MIDIVDIRGAIVAGHFTNAELDSIQQAIQFARSQLTHRNKSALRRGDTVKFTSNRNGQTYQGTVEKIAIKYVNVRTAVGVYRVPANMLEAV